VKEELLLTRAFLFRSHIEVNLLILEVFDVLHL